MAFPLLSTAKSGLKRTILAGTTALALGGIVAGVAAAQQGPTPTPTRPPAAGAQATPQGTPQGSPQQRLQQFWDLVASKLGVTPDRLRQAMAEARTELGIPEGVRGHRPGGFGHRGPSVRYSLDVAAQTMGIGETQLRQELTGTSLAAVARAHNVDPARVADAMKADANTRIDQAVADGRITAEQAAQLKQQVGPQVDQLMQRTMPDRSAKRGWPGGRGQPTPTPTPGGASA
ncbi:MAG: hypothetical protein ACRDJN_13360 [Chloroflexota bacterium]